MSGDAIRALVVIASVGALVQSIKIIIDIIRKRTFTLRSLWSGGGFPSFHSAVSAAVIMVIYYEEGLSLLFVVSLVFAGLLWYDAINVRYEAGKHASYLNVLRGELVDVFSRGQTTSTRALNERIGHTLPEVVAGILIAVTMTSLFYVL